MPRHKRKTTVFNIREIAKNNGVENAHQLHLKTGISVPRSKKLWLGKSKIGLDDINIICDKFSCEVSDIIIRVPAGRN